MAEYWDKAQLDRITPPQVLDARGSAYLNAVNEVIGADPITGFYVKDADTCPAAALPALIAEYGMEKFIDDDLPEYVQRRILKNTWSLKALLGYDAGVKMGLELLGLTAEIEQWWQVAPKRSPNTHTIYFRAEELIFEADRETYPSREMAAATQMINLTKRASQESTIVFVDAVPDVALSIGAATRGRVVDRASFTPLERTA